jgi:heme-degrading monooxygenase HmoA
LRGFRRCNILPSTRKVWPARAGREGGWSMPYLFERHRVRDYARWREVFDADTRNREAAGCRGARVFRNAEDPEEVVVLFEWDSLERARRRIESARLKEEFEEAGVRGGIGQTEFYLLEEEAGPSA